ncbi:hypothetical protein [Sorangium sp. So ce233]|uniref:hypothetical protein n=1 Tax=Sorangium sp. So ce233 TaxID=3133290 RepID=UPI003F5EC95E
MAYTSAQRVQIRRYMGVAPNRNQRDDLDALITATQSTADGGTMPDSETETYVVSLLTALATLQTNISNLWEQMQADSVDKLRVDPVRAMMALRSDGRRLVGDLATALDFAPKRDVFSGAVPGVL